MRVRDAVAILGALVFACSLARAGEFRLAEVRSLGAAPAPQSIAFTDHQVEDLADPATGLISFEDWARTMPVQKQFLNLYPSFTEPTVTVTQNGVAKSAREKLHMYVAEARFMLAKPARSIDLARYTTIPVLERIDPAIKERVISPTDIANDLNKNPNRPWCEAKPGVICLGSRYDLEGKLPTGIRLANQLVESKKKIAEYLEFHSEVRILSGADLDQAGLAKLTGIDAPVVSALEQNIFYVNQVMQFGKFLAVLQPDPTDPSRTVATAFIALGVKS
ncbi:MAG TPA: hypothetical protein VK281_16735, partial [Xanthobacteraceae bacterium]|nr:hypothetical protein [Xanthobacteraceae bacterium]